MRVLLSYVFDLVGVIGLSLLASLLVRRERDAIRQFAFGIIAFGLLAYLAFWVYFLIPSAGPLCSLAILAALTVFGFRAWARSHRLRTPDGAVLFVPLVMLFAGLFYLSLLNLLADPRLETVIAEYRFFAGPLPPDNALPMLFAERLIEGTDPRALLPPWQSSDRPPLQTAFFLLLWPIAGRLARIDVAYQALGTCLQLVWIPSVCYVAQALGAARRDTGRALLVMLFCGFCFANSVYVWPKLLAGSLGMFACGFLIDQAVGTLPTRFTWASLAFGLALLSHGGVAFSLPLVLACSMLAFRERGTGWDRWLAAAVAVGSLVAVMAPWIAYQRLYDPPGDQVLKVNLAGVDGPHPGPLIATMIEAYRSLSWPEAVSYKWQNLTTLFGRWTSELWDSPDAWRQAEFRYLLRTLSVANVGWIWLPGFLSGRTYSDSRRAVAAGTGLSLVFWIAAMFGPGTTLVHLGSYTTMLMLLLVLALSVSRLPRAAWRALFGVQMAIFVALWVITAPTGRSIVEGAAIRPSMAVVALVSAGMLVWTVERLHIEDCRLQIRRYRRKPG